MVNPAGFAVELGLLWQESAEFGGELMIVPNPYLVVDEGRARQRRLIDEAERFRMRDSVQADITPRRGYVARVRRRLGAWLIAAGQRMVADVPSVHRRTVSSL